MEKFFQKFRKIKIDRRTSQLMDHQTYLTYHCCVRVTNDKCEISVRPRMLCDNRSPKGNMWSAIPVALLYMDVNQNGRKQGSGPEGDEVL